MANISFFNFKQAKHYPPKMGGDAGSGVGSEWVGEGCDGKRTMQGNFRVQS